MELIVLCIIIVVLAMVSGGLLDRYISEKYGYFDMDLLNKLKAENVRLTAAIERYINAYHVWYHGEDEKPGDGDVPKELADFTESFMCLSEIAAQSAERRQL